MRRTIWICWALAVAAGCTTFVGAGAETGGIPPRPPDAPYPNWEHMCVRSSEFGGMGGFLTAAGAQGWELVAITSDNMYCFKRPVAPPGGFGPPGTPPPAPPGAWRDASPPGGGDVGRPPPPPSPPPPPPPPPPAVEGVPPGPPPPPTNDAPPAEAPRP